MTAAQCARCGATKNLGISCAHPDCPHRATAAFRRVNVNFSERHMAALHQNAAHRGVNLSESLRGSLALLKWLDDLQRQGARLIREDAQGRRQEVVFL